MQRAPRNSIKTSTCLFLILLLLYGSSSWVSASQEVIYKEARPLKKIFSSDGSISDKAPVKTYLYDPTGKTDPFKSFIALREETKEKEKKRPRTYLETLELSQLDLIVIVIGKKGRWSMVRDSKGVGHVIKEGTAIGRNSGVVYKIQEGEVIIREEYTDFKGSTKFKEIVKKTPSLR